MSENLNNSTQQGNTMAPDNYLAWAIIATLLCCWPFGIPAIVNAAKVDKLWMCGRQNEAIIAANNAKKWTTISAVSAIVFWVFYLIAEL